MMCIHRHSAMTLYIISIPNLHSKRKETKSCLLKLIGYHTKEQISIMYGLLLFILMLTIPINGCKKGPTIHYRICFVIKRHKYPLYV